MVIKTIEIDGIDPLKDIMQNINDGIIQGYNNSIANQILELQQEADLIELKLKDLKTALQTKMESSGINSIKTDTAIFTLVERENIKVDAEKCRSFLDSAGIYEEFSKVDETKVKKIYPTAEFIKVGTPTKYLKITGVK